MRGSYGYKLSQMLFFLSRGTAEDDDDDFFSKFSSGRCDRFRQKIVEIGAILAIFEPFEHRKFTCHFLANSADRPRICANLIRIRTNPGAIG